MIKKANPKDIAKVSKMCKCQLGLLTTWQVLWEKLADFKSYSIGLDTKCPKNGDTTTIDLYIKEDIIQSWTVPNKDVFIPKLGDWEWNNIYRLLVTYILHPRKCRTGQKSK